MDHAEEQAMELEALEAIYMEEFERLVRPPRDAYRHAHARAASLAAPLTPHSVRAAARRWGVRLRADAGARDGR